VLPRFVGRSVFAGFALISLVIAAPEAFATEAACIPGNHTVAPPCTFDAGLVSLDSATSPEPTGGGGHHTIVSFPTSAFGPGIEVAADIANGNPPYSATDTGGTSSSGSITFTLSTVGGSYLIDALRFSLIDPLVTGTGSIGWSLGSASDGFVSGDQTTSSGDLNLASAAGSVTETIAGTLSAGTSGSATMTGYEVFVHLVPVPESSTGLLVFAGLFGLAGWRRARA